jgi:hypothetical protein
MAGGLWNHASCGSSSCSPWFLTLFRVGVLGTGVRCLAFPQYTPHVWQSVYNANRTSVRNAVHVCHEYGHDNVTKAIQLFGPHLAVLFGSTWHLPVIAFVQHGMLHAAAEADRHACGGYFKKQVQASLNAGAG